MITPKLEELILCGQAEYKTFGCQFSSNYKLKIPDGCVVVVTDIIWNNFLQTPAQTDPSLKDWSEYNAVQIRFSDTNKKMNHLHIRNSMKIYTSANYVFNAQADKVGGGAFQNGAIVMPDAPRQYDVYFVHKKLLEINVIMHEVARQFVFSFNQIVDAPGQLLKPPIDSGGLPGAALNTVTYARNNATGTDICENYPQGLQFTPAPAPSSVASNEFIQLNHQRYQMQNPSTLSLQNNSSPLFTVGYVMIRNKEIFSALSGK